MGAEGKQEKVLRRSERANECKYALWFRGRNVIKLSKNDSRRVEGKQMDEWLESLLFSVIPLAFNRMERIQSLLS